MSWGQAQITVVCDTEGCFEQEYIYLTETARGWDARYVDEELREMGWEITDTGQYCPCCKEIREDNTDETR